MAEIFSILIFIYAILVSAIYLFFTYFTDTSFTSNNFNNKTADSNISDIILEFPVQKIISNNKTELVEHLNLSDTVVYVDMWRSHWCTYYNDREFFFTPRINELLQRFRRLNVSIVSISSVVDGYLPFSKQRKRGSAAVKKGSIPAITEYNAQQERYHYEYNPGFQDICVYSDLTRYGYTRDNRFTPKIAIGANDYFVSNFQEAAECFVGMGKKNVIIVGQHTNMCLMAVMLFSQQANLNMFIVRDLVDACWVYDLQKLHHNTHTKGNEATNSYFERKFGKSILSFDLIRAMKKYDNQTIDVKYSYFKKTAKLFKYL